MSLIKKFNETGKEIGSENVPLDNDNLSSYIEQYGKERAEGYQAGMSDILMQVDIALNKPRPYSAPPESPTPVMIRNRFEFFYEEQMKFLKTALVQQIKEQGSQWQQGYLDSIFDFAQQADSILYTYSEDDTSYHRNSDSPIRRNIEKYFKEKSILIKILEPTIKAFTPNLSA